MAEGTHLDQRMRHWRLLDMPGSKYKTAGDAFRQSIHRGSSEFPHVTFDYGQLNSHLPM